MNIVRVLTYEEAQELDAEDGSSYAERSPEVTVGRWFVGAAKEPTYTATWTPDIGGDGDEIEEEFPSLEMAIARATELIANADRPEEDVPWAVPI